MPPFTVFNHISKKEYIAYVLQLTYRKWYIILITVFCILGLLFYLLDLLQVSDFYNETPVLMIAFAIYFLLIIPLLMRNKAGKNYASNRRIQQTITYTFSEEGIAFKGDDFEGQYSWNNVIKIKQTKKYLLLYLSRNAAELIKKDILTPQQQAHILTRRSS